MGAFLATPIAVAASLLSTRPSDVVYWCKWITSYYYVSTFRRCLQPRFDSFDMDADGDPYKTDFLPFPEEITLESPLPESQLINTADEVLFFGLNSKNEHLIVRIGRGTNHEAETWISLKLSNGKVYQLEEKMGIQQSSSDKRTFSCGGLQIHYLSPMRRWRIFFNGLLNEINEDGELSEKKVHVKFALIWRASTDPFDFRTHVDSKALATSLAKVKWNEYSPPVEKLFKALNLYTQGGIFMGTVTIDGSEDEIDLYLFGERLRFMGNIPSLEGLEAFHILGHVPKNGRFVHYMQVSIANLVEKLNFGFATVLTGGLRPIQAKDCSFDLLINEERAKKDIEAKFHSGKKLFLLKGTVSGRQNNVLSNENAHSSVMIDGLNFELKPISTKEIQSLKNKEFDSLPGGEIGKGFLIHGYRKITNLPKRTIVERPSDIAQSAIPLVAHFSEKICQNSEITGGKGSSLGKLTELSKELQNFVVPNGIVVTTKAYELFVTDDILKEVKKLENAFYRDKLDETKAACQRLMEEVIKTSIPDVIRQAIVTSLQNAFPDRKPDHKFAVRSSATGEDTEQMSAAGQMETFLGVAGISEIMSAIKKCWASQFSFIAVQYKRQNGQVINTPMAVVVQEMIPCDIAGVLFTCDPLTGNPTTMSVTANYGLGESVVSGSEEPDTIEIERLDENDLKIRNKIIGSKSHRIVLKDDGGTNVEDVSENEKQSCCLSDNMALRLGSVALKIEKCYRSYRDIEWGFWNNSMYIFQSRPVTSGAEETEFEIDHEFDAPLRCEGDYFAMCNVGEVMPGATTPLSLDLLLKYMKAVFQSRRFISWQKGLARYYPRGIVSMYRHVMFYCVDLFQHAQEDTTQSQASAVGLFGRVIDEKELFAMAVERHGDEPVKYFTKTMYLRLLYKMFYGAKSRLKWTINHYAGYTVPSIKYKNSEELFEHLLSCCSDLTLAMGSHMVCSEVSSFLNMFIFITLQKAIGEINADVYSDFSQLLTTSSEVESADVPKAMEKLAFFIYKEKKPEDFKSMKTEEALRWLQTTQTTAGEKYRDFLKRHGHRCLREFDIFSLTWREDPHSLVKLLQNLVGSITEEKAEKKPDDLNKLISELKAPLTRNTKFLLKVLLPLSRKAVQNRECSKSLLIRAVNEWRKGYRKLAKLMVLEGRIPDEDLLFFMTLEEIKELLETRSPRVISKANYRRRRQPIIDRYIFPEIIQGFPMPINAANKITVNTDDNFSMKGLPVSRGVATGIVRVALDLEEASLLQPGEILVTYSTDIGWSPYFPMLGGVVTELGGLISHGAVVSREYGLPCIAGLHGATQQFKTGDYVLLDGNKGILQNLPKPEDT